MWTDIYADLDLWMMNRDGSQQALFVPNGREPAWSLTDTPEPLVLDRPLFLPVILDR
jgi:hypothetical protein